jgi:adenosylmethionine-8-amino-7-oxononanoate aminotransferase
VQRKAKLMEQWLSPLKDHAGVSEVRQCGLIAGIELRTDNHTTSGGGGGGGTELGDFGESPSKYLRRVGYEVCDLAREQGVIIRPLGNVVILMPPLSIRDETLKRLVEVTAQCIDRIADSGRG